MATWHLDELRAALEKRGWRVVVRVEHGAWELDRAGDPRQVVLDLEGFDPMRVHPISDCRGCRVRGAPHALAFRTPGQRGAAARARWRRELAAFVAARG